MAKKRLEAQLGADTSEFDSKIKGAGKTAQSFGDRVNRVFGSIAQQMVAAIGVTQLVSSAFNKLKQIISNSVADFAAFETGQKNVQSLLETFDGNLERRTITIMKEYGLTIQDTNKSLFDAVSAGIPAAKATQFMAAAAKLATAGVTDLTTATDGLTSIMNAYSLSVDEAEDVANAFFTAQKFGKTTVQELSHSIGMVAPIAKTAGVSYQELLAVMAQLTKGGISTRMSATSLRAAIAALINPSEQAKAAMESYGIETGVAAIKQNGLFKSLSQIAEVTRTNENALTEFIPSVEALVGVSSLTIEKMAEYSDILKAVSTDTGSASSMTKGFESQMDSLGKTTDKTNARLKEQSVLLGKELKPVANLGKDATSVFIQFGRFLFSRESVFEDIARANEQTYEALRELRLQGNELFPSLLDAKDYVSPFVKPEKPVTQEQITTLTSLNKELSDQEKLLSEINIKDTRAIALQNQKIQGLKDQIEQLILLGIQTKKLDNEFSGKKIYQFASEPDKKGLKGGPASVPTDSEILPGLEQTINLVSTLDSTFQNMFANTQNGLRGMAEAFKNAITQMAAQLAAKAAIFGILTALTGGAGGIANIATKLLGGKGILDFMGIPQFGSAGGGGGSVSGSITVGGQLKGSDIHLSNTRAGKKLGRNT
jgi:TP901 family phage tail tape measure protein